MCWAAPAEEADDAGLELEDDADAGVEAAKIVGHCGDVEVGPLGKGARLVRGEARGEGVVAAACEAIRALGNDLLKEPG